MKYLKLFFVLGVLTINTPSCAMYRLAIFDVSSIIKQDIDKKQSELVTRLYGKDSYWNLLKLGKISHKVFGLSWADMIKVLLGDKYKNAQEHKARMKFFEFLRGIKVDKALPIVLFEGDELPPIMAGWVLGVYKPHDVIDKAFAYIDGQELDDDVAELFRALVFVTFTPEIMARSCKKDEETLRLVDDYAAQQLPVYLVGHCDPAAHDKLHQDPEGRALLEKFKGHVLFSYQTYADHVTPETQFDDVFWVRRLGVTEVVPGDGHYLFYRG